MSAAYPEEAKNFRLIGHDPSAAWGGGSLVQVHKGHAYVGAVGGSSYNGPEGFTVHDVPRAAEHYQRLGFTVTYHDEDYAFAHRDQLTIHLAGPGADPERVGGGSIYMHVDDADALAEEWRGAGVDLVEPQDYEYGKREGSHLDPDGNLIRFGSPLRR